MPITTTDRLPLALWAFSPLLVLGPALTCVAPRVMGLLYLMCGVFAICADIYQKRKLPNVRKYWLYAVAGFVAYASFTRIWSLMPEDAIGKAFELGFIFAVTVFLIPVLCSFDAVARKRLGYMFAAGFGIGAAVYISELLNGFKLYDMVRGGKSHDVADVKQNKAAFLLAVWAYLSFPYFVPKRPWLSKALYGACALGLYYVTFTSKSASAQLIVALVPVLIGTLWLLPSRLALSLALVACISIAGFMPFVALGTYRYTDWLHSDVINDSLRSRIEIWDQAARRTLEKPFFGWGIDSSPKMPDRGEVSKLYEPKIPIAHLHPHNAPLQIWFELGAIGIAALVALFRAFQLRILRFTSTTAQKFATFTWSVAFLYTLSIWGIWQGWFVATLCFMAAMTILGARHIDEQVSQAS